MWEAYEDGDVDQVVTIFFKQLKQTLSMLFKTRQSEAVRNPGMAFAISAIIMNSQAIRISNQAYRAIQEIETKLDKFLDPKRLV